MRKLFTILAAFMLVIAFVFPAQAEIQAMWARVYKKTNLNQQSWEQMTQLTTGVTFKVLQRNSDTAETLYEYPDMDDKLTSLTNPVTAANFASDTVCKDRVAFQVDPGETNDRYVDLIVVDTSGGFTAFVEDFDKWQHTIIIDETANVLHHGVIWTAPSDNSETDTGIDFLADTFIHDVWVEVVTVDATETIDVGLLSTESSGDANGLRAAVSVATAGFIADTGVITGGTNIDYTPATTYGALLVTAITGSDAIATNGGKSYIGHVVTGTNAKSLTYTGSAGSDTAVCYIHYFFTRMR